MSRTERVILSAAILATLAISLGWRTATAPAPAPATQPALSIATVDIFSLAEKLLQTSTYVKPRQELSEAHEAKYTKLRDEGEEIKADLDILPASEPKAADKLRELQAKRAEFDAALREANTALDVLQAGQLVSAYEAIITSARAIAERDGYTFVLAARAPNHPFSTSSLNTTVQEILARPLIEADSTDITAEVASQLNLD